MTANPKWPAGVFNIDCRDCPRLASFLDTVKAKHPEYHCRPVPPFGDPKARLLIVGLAPGMHGANRTGRPFTGDFAGILLYETLHRHGLASRPESVSADDGLELLDCRLTNAVKCLPPQNKPTTEEIRTCNHYLSTEIDKMLPEGGVILALGKIGHDSVLRSRGLKLSAYKFAHGAEHDLGELTMVDSYHASRYNTQTKRLTEKMFDDVVARAKELAKS
ncbi:MAG TPA: uracil-DNA glycosylase [Gammaproteobacteria bacterium]